MLQSVGLQRVGHDCGTELTDQSKKKIHLIQTEHRNKSFPKEDLHKSPNKPHPLGTENKSKRNYDHIAWGKEISNTVS